MQQLRLKLNHITHNQDGLAYVEFVISIPLLLLLLFGAIDVSRYVMISQKLQSAINTVGDIVAQESAITKPALLTNEVPQLMNLAQNMLQPYYESAKVGIIISNVLHENGSAKLKWQACGGGTLGNISRMGKVIGSTVAIPSNMVLAAGDEVVVAEIYYQYTPLTVGLITPPITMYRSAVYTPRNSSAGIPTLSTLVGNCP